MERGPTSAWRIGHHIAGRAVDSRDERTFESRNPAHRNEVIAIVARGGAVEVEAAVEAAREASASWRRTPWPGRGEIILRAAELLGNEQEDLARLITREMGKPLREARGDVQEAIDVARFIASEGRRAFGETVPSEAQNRWAMTKRYPFGIVGCITPWNYPIAIPSWKIFPAVLAGNTVVFKPAEDTPASALRFVEILEQAGLPPGVVNVVFGFGEECGDAIVSHPAISAIFFTGGVETGRIVAEKCGRLLKKVSLELGGKNAIVVLDDADVERAVDGALRAGFGTSGQRCTASSRLIVQRGIAGDFTDQLISSASKLRIGDGLSDTVDLGPVINEAQLRRIHEYTLVGQGEGARLLLGGDVAREDELAEGWFYRPTIFGDVSPTMRVAQEEIFGPTVAIMPVDSLIEALAAANSTSYGLSLSVYTNNLRHAFQAIEELDSGIVYVNAPTAGAEIQLPFGGTKNTGNGHRDIGGNMVDEFTEWKAVYIDYSGPRSA